MGFFTRSADGEAYSGDEDSDGTIIGSAEPGEFEELPAGMDIKTFDPNHPNTAFGDFTKSILRSVAGGMGISYTTLSQDLESVNYSSIRAGLLEEREQWITIQEWFKEGFAVQVYESWLTAQVFNGTVSVPQEQVERFNSPQFTGRRWPWVDPLKDVQAHEKALALGFTSRTRIVQELGRDLEEVFEQRQEDDELAETHNQQFGQTETPEKPETVEEKPEKDEPKGDSETDENEETVAD
jgi:lambda family phage portal protein